MRWEGCALTKNNRHAQDPRSHFLIVHGNSENTVPFNQSELLVPALKQAGAEVTFEVVQNGGHGFNAEQSQRLKPIVVAFFDKHLKSPSAK